MPTRQENVHLGESAVYLLLKKMIFLFSCNKECLSILYSDKSVAKQRRSPSSAPSEAAVRVHDSPGLPHSPAQGGRQWLLCTRVSCELRRNRVISTTGRAQIFAFAFCSCCCCCWIPTLLKLIHKTPFLPNYYNVAVRAIPPVIKVVCGSTAVGTAVGSVPDKSSEMLLGM